MASKTKIYIVLEYVDGGELFDKIVSCHGLEFGIFMLWISNHPKTCIYMTKIIVSFTSFCRLSMENLKKMLLGVTFNNSLMLWTTATAEVYTIEILRWNIWSFTWIHAFWFCKIFQFLLCSLVKKIVCLPSNFAAGESLVGFLWYIKSFRLWT